MILPRIVPWMDWDEWLLVWNHLFSPVIELRIEGVNMVSLWRERGKLPHSIDSTAQLVNIMLQDSAFNHATLHPLSEYNLRSLYSFAIIRTVNGLVDNFQQGYFAESIYTLANKIGIPGWIVELRHDSTHNELPPTAIVRSAAVTLLDWLRNQYWDPQMRHIQSLTQRCLDSIYANDKSTSKADVDEEIDIAATISVTSLSQFYIPAFFDILLQMNSEGVASASPSDIMSGAWYSFESVLAVHPLAVNLLLEHSFHRLEVLVESLVECSTQIEPSNLQSIKSITRSIHCTIQKLLLWISTDNLVNAPTVALSSSGIKNYNNIHREMWATINITDLRNRVEVLRRAERVLSNAGCSATSTTVDLINDVLALAVAVEKNFNRIGVTSNSLRSTDAGSCSESCETSGTIAVSSKFPSSWQPLQMKASDTSNHPRLYLLQQVKE